MAKYLAFDNSPEALVPLTLGNSDATIREDTSLWQLATKGKSGMLRKKKTLEKH